MGLLEDVFGGTSDEDDGGVHGLLPQFSSGSLSAGQPYCTRSEEDKWEGISCIDGLWLCKDFLSDHRQAVTLRAIENGTFPFTDPQQGRISRERRRGFLTHVISGREKRNMQKDGFITLLIIRHFPVFFDLGRLDLFDLSCMIFVRHQAMRFGDLPSWAVELSDSVRESVLAGGFTGTSNACILPSDLLWREPLFDQMIVNVYQPGEGISAHVDLARFEDGIAVVSLDAACVMHFSWAGGGMEDRTVPVYLNAGSLLLMSGEARYYWKHEINRKPGFQVWEGKEIVQVKRTSITLRKLHSPP